MKINSTSGQALVETVLVIVFVLGIFFSLVQLFHLGIVRMLAFDATGCAVRARMIKKDHKVSIFYVLHQEIAKGEVLPYSWKYSVKDVKTGMSNSQGEILKIATVRLKYLQKVMFPSFFSFIGQRMLPSDATCRLIMSPEVRFFNQSFPGAKLDK